MCIQPTVAQHVQVNECGKHRTLADALQDALKQEVEESTPEVLEAAKQMLNYVQENPEIIQKALQKFCCSGRLKPQRPLLPASAYNDLYKWTMLPIMWATERAYGEVRCTFSMNVRDVEARQRLKDSIVSGTGLIKDLTHELKALANRPFDRSVYERVAQDCGLKGWDDEVMDAVCGPRSKPKTLADKVVVDLESSRLDPGEGEVLIQVFNAYDTKLKDTRLFIEATGPWHRVTWLETSMMQAVYDVLFRELNRSRVKEKDDCVWYPKWLAKALVRCARSVASAKESGLKGALFSGRRTGGLPLLILQALYVEQAFRDENSVSKHLGMSSVTTRYWLLDAGIPPDLIPRVAGTHAHELSMVLSAVMGDIDDKSGMPLSQIVGHTLYFFLSLPNGDVRDSSRKALMPMLPDTLGTRAFMKTANLLKVPRGPHKGEALLSIVGAARQDSGQLSAFKELMDEYKFTGALMASEIEVEKDLFTARDNGYALFGAGGFFGDSEKAWNPDRKNISMANKIVRVCVDGQATLRYPVKTGDGGAGREGKFEVDGVLDEQAVQEIRDRTQSLQSATPKLDVGDLQQLFEDTLNKILPAE